MSQTPNSNTVRDGIRVRAAAQYLPEQSDPDRRIYLYAYKISMTNEGFDTIRLKYRHWSIVDADGHSHEVHGPGVVGEFPELEPGDSYEYVSSCPLRTEWGTMEGHYDFETEDGERRRAEVGRFFLVPQTQVEQELYT